MKAHEVTPGMVYYLSAVWGQVTDLIVSITPDDTLSMIRLTVLRIETVRHIWVAPKLIATQYHKTLEIYGLDWVRLR